MSLVTSKCDNKTRYVPVIRPRRKIHNFTVCVTPLNLNYSNVHQLVEMIELNRMLGADYFVFYNYSTWKTVDAILEYYKELGIAEVIQWKLPVKVDTWPPQSEYVEVHYFGQLAALNDCLFRNKGRSLYVVYQDLDEFIIPRKHEDWFKLMKTLPPKHGSYMFRSTFFRKEWPDVNSTLLAGEGRNKALKYNTITILKQFREDKIFGRSHRSKYIVNPDCVECVGIHNVWRFSKNCRTIFVDTSAALVHHYRSWDNPDDAKKGVLDRRMDFFKNNLLSRIEGTWHKLKSILNSLWQLNELEIPTVT